MFAINLITIFVFGIVITAIVFKGMMQAEEFAKLQKQYDANKASNDKGPTANQTPLDTY